MRWRAGRGSRSRCCRLALRRRGRRRWSGCVCPAAVAVKEISQDDYRRQQHRAKQIAASAARGRWRRHPGWGRKPGVGCRARVVVPRVIVSRVEGVNHIGSSNGPFRHRNDSREVTVGRALRVVLGQSMFRPPRMRAVMRCNNKPGVYQCEKERIVPEALICVRASTNRRAERGGGAGVNARETAHHLCIFNHGCDLLIENMIDQLAIRALSL